MQILPSKFINSVSVNNIILITFFSSLSLIYCFWTWSNLLGMFGGDNAWYLLMAKYLSPYSEHSETVDFFARHSPYPVLMPLILAYFGGAENIAIAHFITTIFLLLSFYLLYIWMLNLNFSKWISILTIFVFAITPITYIHALEILSENYFLFFCLLSIYLIEIHDQHDNKKNIIYLAAITVGLSILIRNAGVSLIFAFIIYSILKFKSKKSVTLILLSITPLILSTLLSFKIPGQHSYLDWMLNIYQQMNSFNKIYIHFADHFSNFLSGWFNIFSANNNAEKIIFLILGFICISGTFLRLINKKLDGFFVATYLALILLWPFAHEPQRYLYPILPILIVHGLYIFHRKKEKLKIPVNVIMLLIILATNIPVLLWATSRYFSPINPEYSEYKHSGHWYKYDYAAAISSVKYTEQLTSDMKNIGSFLEQDDCVYHIKPSILSLYSDKLSFSPPDEKLNQNEFLKELKINNCKYFLTIPQYSISYSEPHYPLKQIQNLASVIKIGTVNNTTSSILLKLNDGL